MTGLEGIKPTGKHEKEACQGCIYLSSSNWCDYREMTGRSRYVDGGPLLPDGGCKLYKKGVRVVNKSPWPMYERQKKKDQYIEYGRDKKQKPFRPPSKYAREIEHWYEQGLSDMKIAEKVGCGHTTVQRWRARNKLESNFMLDRRKRAAKRGK